MKNLYIPCVSAEHRLAVLMFLDRMGYTPSTSSTKNAKEFDKRFGYRNFRVIVVHPTDGKYGANSALYSDQVAGSIGDIPPRLTVDRPTKKKFVFEVGQFFKTDKGTGLLVINPYSFASVWVDATGKVESESSATEAQVRRWLETKELYLAGKARVIPIS